MERKFVVMISAATVFLIVLLFALSSLRSSPNTNEQSADQAVVPTRTPFFQLPSAPRHTINSNEDTQLSLAEKAAIEESSKKLPFSEGGLNIEYSGTLNTFYVQNSDTNIDKFNKFLEENKLSELYKSNPKLFKKTKLDAKYVMDEDEFTYFSENEMGESSLEELTPSPTPNPNDPMNNVKPAMNIFKTLMGFNTVLAPSSINNGTQQSTTGKTPAPIANNTNCNNIIGNERIICAALKYTGIRYGFSNNRAKQIEKWGVPFAGTNGYDPATWLAHRTPEGPTDFLGCSGYTELAIYVAFGFYNKKHCSISYLSDPQYFKKIDPNAARPGDLLIKGTACSSIGGGHVAIFVKRYANGSTQTLEATAAKPARSGYYNRKPGTFTRAVRYIGPGSTP